MQLQYHADDTDVITSGQGYLHLPSIGDRAWAPPNGYSLFFWIYVEKLVEENHITISLSPLPF